ncbi:MAG: hypothetical protein RL094_52 [Candidatus Parcubacteria bacterium]|jgi:hypothetical protein
MADDLDLPTGVALEEENEEVEKEPDFVAAGPRTMSPAHDHEPIDDEQIHEDELDGHHGHGVLTAAPTEEEENAAEEEIVKNYFLNGYDDEAPYSEFDEHGEPTDY